jgi:hypothetical protein
MNCFSPENFSDDITIVEMRSLGRGKGFQITKEFSIFEDEELLSRLKLRVTAINAILEIDMGEKLNLKVKELENENDNLREEVTELRVDLSDTKNKLEDVEEEFDDKEQELLNRINEALPDEYDEFTDLGEAVDALITDYSEAIEEAEDND